MFLKLNLILSVPEDSSMIEYIEGDAQKLQNINQVKLYYRNITPP